MNTELLNKVKDLIIDTANKNGIILANEFKDRDEFAQFVIALSFKTLTDAGVATDKAYETIMGEGEYEKLFNRVYDELKAA